MCLTFNIGENGRQKIGIAITVLDGILAMFGLAVIAMGIYMNNHLESKMQLLHGYDTGTLPYFLIIVGGLMVGLDTFFAKVAFDSAFPESRARFQFMLTFFLAIKFILLWTVFAGSMICFAHREVIEESLKNGLYSVMNLYKKDMEVKILVDQLQMNYRCCGSNQYSDWFKVSWVNEQYLDMKNPGIRRKMKDGRYFSDDVPFSCCSIDVERPCSHVNIEKGNRTKYKVTVYKRGCAGTLMSFFEDSVLTPTGFFILTGFFLQVISTILFRLLQSSIHDACFMADPLGVGAASVCPNCPCKMCSTGDPMKYVKRGESGGNETDHLIDEHEEESQLYAFQESSNYAKENSFGRSDEKQSNKNDMNDGNRKPKKEEENSDKAGKTGEGTQQNNTAKDNKSAQKDKPQSDKKNVKKADDKADMRNQEQMKDDKNDKKFQKQKDDPTKSDKKSNKDESKSPNKSGKKNGVNDAKDKKSPKESKKNESTKTSRKSPERSRKDKFNSSKESKKDKSKSPKEKEKSKGKSKSSSPKAKSKSSSPTKSPKKPSPKSSSKGKKKSPSPKKSPKKPSPKSSPKGKKKSPSPKKSPKKPSPKSSPKGKKKSPSPKKSPKKPSPKSKKKFKKR